MRRLAGIFGVVTLAATWISAQGPAHEFRPDSTFSGSTLAGWHTLGASQWKAQNGELIGTATGPGGGWLVLDASYQDLNFSRGFAAWARPPEPWRRWASAGSEFSSAPKKQTRE